MGLPEGLHRVRGEPVGPFDHPIHHPDCEGYYVPVDFGQVIVDERLLDGAGRGESPTF
jgi:hypothetical protein